MYDSMSQNGWDFFSHSVLARRDVDGRTAALWAARSNSVHTIRILRYYGADLSAVDNEGASILHLGVHYSPATYSFCDYLIKVPEVGEMSAFSHFMRLGRWF